MKKNLWLTERSEKVIFLHCSWQMKQSRRRTDEYKQMDAWTAALHCSLYSGGSVCVSCQKLGCSSINVEVYAHTQTQHSPIITDRRFLPLSEGFDLYELPSDPESWYLPSALLSVRANRQPSCRLEKDVQRHPSLHSVMFYIWRGKRF